MGQGSFRFARTIRVDDLSARLLLDRLRADAVEQMKLHGERFQWLVDGLELWIAVKDSLPSLDQFELGYLLTGKDRVDQFVAALHRVEVQEPSINPAVFQKLKMLATTS